MKRVLMCLGLCCLGMVMFAEAEEFQVVGVELPPLMYQDNGTAKGFYVDILESMLELMDDVTITIKFYPAKRTLSVLSEQENTFSLGMTRNETRETLYQWVGPIYPRIFALYKLKRRTDIHVSTLEDLPPYTIGVGKGYAAVDDLLRAGVSHDKIDDTGTDVQNIRKLFLDRIDFVVGNDVMIAYALQQEGHQWDEVEQVLILNDQYEFWFAFNKNIEKTMIQRFQDAFDQVKQNGQYADIVKSYFQ